MIWKRLVLSGLGILASFSLYGCGGSSAPISVAVTASASTVDATNSVTLSATISHDKNAAGVSWAVSGGGALSGPSTTAATYTAPSSSTTALTVTVTATSIADPKQSGTTTITVPAAPTVTTASLAAGTVGTAYSLALAGSGGISPYSFSITSGTLPAGLTMTSAGAVTGTPMASGVGTSNLTFQMADSGKATPLTATATIALTIKAAPAILFPTSLSTATYNAAYTASVAATGGAGTLSHTLASGTLPAGLTLSAAGAISGISTVVGAFPITVRASDAFGDSATQIFSLTVSYPALTITPPTLPTGYVGSNYTPTTIAATGGSGTGFTFAMTSGSTLPAGLSLSAAGVVTGKPTGAGTVSTSFTVTDSASNTGTATVSFTIKEAVSITTPNTLPLGYVGGAYSQTLVATGGSGSGYTWAVSSGSALPGGLTLSAAGTFSGKPSTVGNPSFTVTATDSVGNTANATFSITINVGVSIGAITLPVGYPGTAYTPTTLTATGGTGTFTSWSWAAASGSTLPTGLSISTAGVVSGNPTNAGTTSVVSSAVVTATDSVGNTGSITLPVTIQATLAISTGATLPGGTISVAYSHTLAATGGAGSNTWSTNPAGTTSLGAIGLTLSSGGVVSGSAPTAGTATFAATVTDSASHTANLTFSVMASNALTVSTSSLPASYSGTLYSQTLAAAGGSGTGYTWSLSAPGNVANFNLSLSVAGLITGTPSSSGTATFTAKVTDSASNTATAPLTITVYNALALPAPNPSSLPSTGTTGAAYTGSINASGGSGTYTWTVTGLPSDGLGQSSGGNTLTISGTPGLASTVAFTAKVTDTATGVSVGPITYSIVVSDPLPLTLPAANPITLPSATANQSYSGSINATGGVGPNYTWTVNGSAIPTSGSAVLVSNGITVSNTGGNTLTVGGTPTTTTTVTLANVIVADSASHTSSPVTYGITVNSAGSMVSGQIRLTGCGTALPGVTVSINTTPVQNTTTDSSGNYSFATVPNGTYTVTPTITGPSSVFYPATQSITVSNSDQSGENFTAALGYTVSGTVSYAGSKTGQTYLTLVSGNCGGNGAAGTSISGTGAFTIRGVAPGTYNLQALMDSLGDGSPNATDPNGNTPNLTVSNANLTDQSVTMTEGSVTLTTAPALKTVNPMNQGVIVVYKAIIDPGKGTELASSYTVQWSTSSGFGTVAGTKTFPAIGANGTDLWVVNGLTNGQTYYFRAEGLAGGSTSPWSAVSSAVTIGAPSGGNTVSGAVTFTGAATGPMYVGFYDQNTNNVYAAPIASPVSAQAYTVHVPTGSNYYFFGIIDQNSNGVVDTGDMSNTHDNGGASTAIVSNTANENLTLPSTNSAVTLTTQHWQQTTQSNTSSGYLLNFNVRESLKLPVEVTLVSGPNVIPLQDKSICLSCGTPQFGFSLNTDSLRPNVGDAYSLKVTYSDGTSETLTPTVSAVLDAFATNLSPISGTSTTPTFTWTDPTNASSYIYSFYISDNNGNTIWQIPGNNANMNGFPHSITSIVWGTDPTGDSTNTPSVGSLTNGTNYNWQIQAQDSVGNAATTQVSYQP